MSSSQDLIFKYQPEDQASLEKWQIPSWGQGIYMMSLGHLLVSESKCQREVEKGHMDTKTAWRATPWPNLGQFGHQKK